MKKIIFQAVYYLILLFFLINPNNLDSQNIKTVNSSEARELINNKEPDELIVIDARRESHFNKGHIPGAINIDPLVIQSVDMLAELDTNNVYLIYCRTNNRINVLFRNMYSMGFKNIIIMTDGWVTWKRLGYEIEKPAE